MVSLENDVIVLDRTKDAEAILPLVHPPDKKGRGSAWFVDIGIEAEDVLNLLIDAEVLGEPVAIRYIAVNGASFELSMPIEELISDADGHRARLRGNGPPPAALLADTPAEI